MCVEVIRQSTPDIALNDLWLALARLPYPLENNDEFSFYSRGEKLTQNYNRNEMIGHARNLRGWRNKHPEQRPGQG